MKEKKITGFASMSNSAEFATNYHKWILEKFKPFIHGNILEIGTGRGYFKKNLKTNGHFVSIDIDKEIIANAKNNEPEGIYFLADISDKSTITPLNQFRFQSVLCFNVLEHIEEDALAIENIMDNLDENGYLLLFVPAFQVLFNDKDKLAGHLRRYTKKTLLQTLQNQTNIKIIKFEYFNPIGAIGYWFNKFVKHKSLNNKSISRQTKFFDKYLVSLSKALNPLTINMFGQSLVCVVQKKNNK